MERYYVCTALYKPIGQGRHAAQRPESQEKRDITETNQTKQQRHGGTPKKLIDNELGDASKYTDFAAGPLEKPSTPLPL
jgi:hypothetical protein